MRYSIIVFCIITIALCTTCLSTERKSAQQNFVKQSLKPSNELEYFIVGMFCGECGGDCAPMYKFDCKTNRLFADHSNSYFTGRIGRPTSFANEITDEKTVKMVSAIRDSIPKLFFKEGTPNKFGCPDCRDGCGIYLEIKQSDKERVFSLDFQASSLSGEVKTFVEYLTPKIEFMRANNK